MAQKLTPSTPTLALLLLTLAAAAAGCEKRIEDARRPAAPPAEAVTPPERA